jgi:hypothetical protein
MKMTTLFPIILLTSICSAVLGTVLGYELFQHRSIDELRVHQIEIEDSDGKPRAHLGVEGDGGVYLRFLTPDQKDSVLLGVQGGSVPSSIVDSSTPLLQLNARNGRPALSISTFNEDGIVAFSDEKRDNTMLLGHFPLPEQQTVTGNLFAWGLHIRREHGETGIGIIDRPGLPVGYISPVAAGPSSAPPR